MSFVLLNLGSRRDAGEVPIAEPVRRPRRCCVWGHATVWGTKAKPPVASWPTALLSLWPTARQDARPFADEAFLSSTCLANNSGSLATFAVIPCASPLLSSLAAERRPRSFSKHTYASCCPL